MGSGHCEQILDLAAGRAPGPLELPGLTAEVAEGRVWLRPRAGRSRITRSPVRVVPRRLNVPGFVDLPEVGLSLTAVLRDACGSSGLLHTGAYDEAVLAAREVHMPLEVRGRKAGDRFRPVGLNGRKKLQDFFVDRKVSRASRDAVPLVVDARDRILWIVGQAVAADFRVTDPAQGVIILKVRRLGGS
jgi:tRNA(Ile)-lysidine synthase